MLSKYPFPTIGEYVICRVLSIQHGYVQVLLEDYGGLPNEEKAHGMVHISELSNRWVKNINSIVSPGQRLVLQVLRVNESRGYVDLSLRRVNKVQRKKIMNDWRYSQKLEGLLKFFADQHEMTLNELYEIAIWDLINQYGNIRSAFEAIKEDGIDKLKDTEGVTLTEEMLNELYDFIIKNVTIAKVNLVVEYDIRSTAGDGLLHIKKAFKDAEDLEKEKGVEAKFIYIGAPIYRVEIEAKDYPTAERHLRNITETLETTISPSGAIELLRDDLSNEQ